MIDFLLLDGNPKETRVLKDGRAISTTWELWWWLIMQVRPDAIIPQPRQYVVNQLPPWTHAQYHDAMLMSPLAAPLTAMYQLMICGLALIG